MNLSDVQLGIVASAFMWVYASFGAIAGLVGDRFQRKTLIIGGLDFLVGGDGRHGAFNRLFSSGFVSRARRFGRSFLFSGFDVAFE